MHTTSTPTPAIGSEVEKPPFAPALVEEVFRQLTKAVRTHQLYLPNNPIYQRAIDTVRAAFEAVWEQTSEIVIDVSATAFHWAGQVVLREPSRSESLPWVFYKDGIRELTFLKGFETDELAILLRIVQRTRNASPDEDDLLTLLWEQEFVSLRYRFVDIGLDQAAPLEPSDAVEEQRVIPSPREEAQAEPERPNNIVRMEDFDSTVYFLDEDEVAYLKREIRLEYEADLPRNVIAILLDVFEVEASDRVREEVCEILEGLILHLLAGAEFGVVAYLLREARMAATRATDATQQQRDRLARLIDRLNHPAVLSKLLQALDEAETAPVQEDLDGLFEQLGPATLGTLLDWTGRVQSSAVRTVLEATATRLAASNTGELVKLITSSEETVAAEAIRRAAALKTPAAVTPLGTVLRAAPPHLRLAAVQALTMIGSPGALRLLEDAVEDDDRDVRLATVRSLSAAGHRAALPQVERLMNGKARDADLTERMGIFEAYGALAGEDGIKQLDALLNAKGGLFGRRPDAETRACAAMALGMIRSPRAVAALERAAGERDALVRNAVQKALRGANG